MCGSLSVKDTTCKSYVPQDSIFVTFLQSPNHRDREPISGCQCLGVERRVLTIRAEWVLAGDKNFLFVVVVL